MAVGNLALKLGWCYTQDGPAYNLGYTPDSNLTNPEPDPNLLTLTVILLRCRPTGRFTRLGL